MDTTPRECLLNWRQDIIAEARTWKGTPFHHKARVKGVGVDCGGFIYEVFKHVIGIPHESFPAYYAEDWALHRDNEIYLAFMQPYVIRVSRPQVADITMWKFGRNFSHGTIYMGNGQYIHSYGRTAHGCVLISPQTMFSIGNGGKKRECRHFTLDPKCL